MNTETTEQKGKQDFNGTIDGAGYKGSMDDYQKPRLTMVWGGFIAGIARVLMYGAKKYARGNWMRGMSFSEVLDATKRHIDAIERGEDFDQDTGFHHVFHAACELMFYAFFATGPRKAEYAAFDDRMYKVEVKTKSTTPVNLDENVDPKGLHAIWKTRRAIQKAVDDFKSASRFDDEAVGGDYTHPRYECALCTYAHEYAKSQGYES